MTQTPASPPESPIKTFPVVPNKLIQNIYTDCSPIIGLVHSDQTGRFIVRCSRGINYLIIIYHEDCNAILVEPMLNQSGPEHKRTYQKIHDDLTKRGFKPQLQRLKNEASEILRLYLAAKTAEY